MQSAIAATAPLTLKLTKTNPAAPALVVAGATSLIIAAGTLLSIGDQVDGFDRDILLGLDTRFLAPITLSGLILTVG